MYQAEAYLFWRGSVPFDAAPFNEVDAYMLAKAGTPDFTGVVPESGEGVSLYEALAGYEALYGTGDSLGVLTSKAVMPTLRGMATALRYSGVKLTGFLNVHSPIETEQFSALTLMLPDGTAYVTFRGTDDTLLGWKENLYLAGTDEVPAQRDALAYLLNAGETLSCPIRVGGHSKGGNLAVYAASKVPQELQERLVEVYSFDGPGFRPAFLDDPGYNAVLPKIKTVIPEHSLVGTLLYRKDRPRVVACEKTGVMAHDGLVWETEPHGFKEAKGLSTMSEAYMRAMRRTLIPMSASDRLAFADAVFEVLTANGAETVTDLTEQGLQKTVEMVCSLGADAGTRRFLLEFIDNLAAELKEPVPDAGVMNKILSLTGRIRGLL